MHTSDQPEQSPNLIRGIGLGGATALNMIDMIGVGPFITMPLVVAAMGGPQALLGWIVADTTFLARDIAPLDMIPLSQNLSQIGRFSTAVWLLDIDAFVYYFCRALTHQ